MIEAKGYVFGFVVSEEPRSRRGDQIELPPFRWLYLHDPAGRDLPKCTVVVQHGRMRPEFEVPNPPKSARQYFPNLPINGMRFNIVDVDRVDWQPLGFCRQIFYDRISARFIDEGQDPFQHPFKTPLIRGADEFNSAMLYQSRGRGQRAYLLTLGEGCIVNWRGFVKP